MKNVRAEILTVDLTQIKNEKTGVVTDMTKIVYRLESDNVNSERHIGSGLMECYRIGNFIEKLDSVVKFGKINQIDIETRPTKNGAKYVITKIDNVTL